MPATDRNHDGETAAAVLRSLALKARGLSGADIERLVREARQKARRQNRALAFADLFDLLASARPERSDALRWRMAVHEAGHAVARLFFNLGTVDTISIDGPNGGYIESRTPGEREETQEFFRALIAITLAGRAAEQELLGSAAGGSGGNQESDLAKATGLALAMETALGFAKEAPLLYRPAEDRSSLLAYNPLIAECVDARLEEAYGEARSLVRSNRDAVYSLAEVLIDTTRWRGGTGGGDRESEEVNRAAARAGMMEEAIIAMMAERRQLWVRWWNPYRQAVSTCLQPDSICNDLRYCDSG